MHFVLVHGAYHGAWCWDDLRKELEADGHETTAVDLPNEDPHAGAKRYAQVVEAAIPVDAKDIVLVGHSLGGLTIPLVASHIEPAGLVYLCAMMPVPGSSFDDQRADLDTGFRPSEPAVGHPDGSASWPEAGAIETFYQDCRPEVARAAAARLTRQYWLITQEVTPLVAMPKVQAKYVLTAEDRAIPASYSRRASRTLLGTDPIELPGGHSPFLSRPRALADLLGGLFVASRAQTS